ncbi:MAG: RdgB/HAM1 family non-canonical purine NTP pyrophosphatase [Parashewanella sp.]
MIQIVLASGNKGKLAEFDQMFSQYQINIVPQSEFNTPDVAETGTTFIENAIIKARHAAQHCNSAAIADDSGIEVDYLNGQPGIYSARYSADPVTGAGATAESNYKKLLTSLEGVTNRKARFQCVLVYMRHSADPTPIIAQASWEGEIALEASGHGGHGYDPVFISQGDDKTVSHMTADEKNAQSHRGKALTILVEALKQQGIIHA